MLSFDSKRLTLTFINQALFLGLVPLAERGQRVHQGAMGEGGLAGLATFSALPLQAFCGAACRARP